MSNRLKMDSETCTFAKGIVYVFVFFFGMIVMGTIILYTK